MQIVYFRTVAHLYIPNLRQGVTSYIYGHKLAMGYLSHGEHGQSIHGMETRRTSKSL